MSDPERVNRTELGDLEKPLADTGATFAFVRDARLFTRRPAELRELERLKRVVLLAPNQLCRPPVPADVAVRLGQIRVTEFLPDGREVARAILQAGSFFRTRPAPSATAETSPARLPATRDLAAIVLMALDDAELWLLPAGALDREAGTAGPAARAGHKGER